MFVVSCCSPTLSADVVPVPNPFQRPAGVTEALAESFAALAPHFLDSTATKPAARAGTAEDDADAPASADAFVDDSSPAAVQRRLDMVPELVHLLSAWAAANRAATGK